MASLPDMPSRNETPTGAVSGSRLPPAGKTTRSSGSSTGLARARSGACQAALPVTRRMKRSTLRSATAAMVADGFVPVAAGSAAPSSTKSPGYPYTWPSPSSTPRDGSSAMGQPPMLWTVSGWCSVRKRGLYTAFPPSERARSLHMRSSRS